MIFSGHTSSFKIGVSKVQDFGNFETFTHDKSKKVAGFKLVSQGLVVVEGLEMLLVIYI